MKAALKYVDIAYSYVGGPKYFPDSTVWMGFFVEGGPGSHHSEPHLLCRYSTGDFGGPLEDGEYGRVFKVSRSRVASLFSGNSRGIHHTVPTPQRISNWLLAMRIARYIMGQNEDVVIPV
jgi:hypothetical protein